MEPLLIYLNEEGVVRTRKEGNKKDEERMTLNQYWERLKEDGLNVGQVESNLNQVKLDIVDMAQMLAKFLQPFLRYFYRLTFQDKKMEHHFHLFSLDILLDENAKPWLLEFSGSPSLKVDFTIGPNFPKKVPASYLQRQEMISSLNAPSVDLQVKAT